VFVECDKTNRQMATRIRVRELSRVFVSRGTILPVYLARLSVLYEDLRIELMATSEKSIPVLDVTDENYRRHYFLRRCIATLVKVAETMRLLDECLEFRAVKSDFNGDLVTYWDCAVSFFRKHERLLKRVRNDIGGHFGQQAALYAVANLDPSAIGQIEARDEATMHLHFAGEIAAAATMRHLQGTSPEIHRRTHVLALLGRALSINIPRRRSKGPKKAFGTASSQISR